MIESVGISTACLYPLYTEKSLKLYVENGVPCTELFLNTFCEMTPAFVRKYREILRNGETKVVSVHPFTMPFESFLLFSSYRRRFEDGVDFYKRYFSFAAELGAKCVVFHGCSQEQRAPYGLYLERYERLHREAKRFGVKLAQENVNRFMSSEQELLIMMKEQIKDISFVLDVKQAVRAGLDFWHVLELMGEKIFHLHLSDHTPEADCLPPGKGEFDFKKLVQKLAVLHISLSPVIELYRENFDTVQELLISHNYLEGILSEMNK